MKLYDKPTLHKLTIGTLGLVVLSVGAILTVDRKSQPEKEPVSPEQHGGTVFGQDGYVDYILIRRSDARKPEIKWRLRLSSMYNVRTVGLGPLWRVGGKIVRYDEDGDVHARFSANGKSAAKSSVSFFADWPSLQPTQAEVKADPALGRVNFKSIVHFTIRPTSSEQALVGKSAFERFKQNCEITKSSKYDLFEYTLKYKSKKDLKVGYYPCDLPYDSIRYAELMGDEIVNIVSCGDNVCVITFIKNLFEIKTIFSIEKFENRNEVVNMIGKFLDSKTINLQGI